MFSPRWMLWHVLTLGAMLTCGGLAIWQWQRAGSALGSAVNVGYGLQWPIFAIFFGVMWWRFLRMEVRELRAAIPDQAADWACPASGAPPSPAETGGPGDPVAAPATTGSASDAPSPFTRAPRRAVPVTERDDPELAEYNRMLAELDAQGRTQTP